MRAAFCYLLLSQITTAVILDVLCLRGSGVGGTVEDSDTRLDWTKLEPTTRGKVPIGMGC